MRSRRVLAFLLGAWLAGTLFVTLLNNQSYRAVERALENQSHPAVRQALSLGSMEARANLRYFTTEVARSFTETWEWIQVALLVLVAGTLLMGQGGGATRWTVVFSVLLVLGALALRLFITPEMFRLGRAVEFLPSTVAVQERSHYFAYSMAYRWLQVAMIVMGAALSVRIVMTDIVRRWLSRSGSEFKESWDEPVGRF